MTPSSASSQQTYDAGPAPTVATGSQAYRSERSLFPGDTGSFPLELRQALVRLLRGPYIDGTVDVPLWTAILTHRVSLQQYLSEIFLLLTIDPDRKIALLSPAGVDAVHTQPLVARKPLRREETLLALRLRMLLDRQAGTGTDVTVTRSGAREILAEHRQPGAVDDKRLDEQTDSAVARLLALKLLLPTELPGEYRVSNALALALPFDSIDQIPAYLTALEGTPDAADINSPGGISLDVDEPGNDLPDADAQDAQEQDQMSGDAGE